MVFPWIAYLEVIEEEEEVVNSINIIELDGSNFSRPSSDPQSFLTLKIEDTETLEKAKLGGIGGAPATINSLHEINNNSTPFQTTNTAKVILIIEGNSSNQIGSFDIIEDVTADAGTGTVKQAVSGVSMTSGDFFTSNILSFAASRFITISLPASTQSDGVFAFIIE